MQRVSRVVAIALVSLIGCARHQRPRIQAAPTPAPSINPPEPVVVEVPPQPSPELAHDESLASAVAHSRRGFAYILRANGTPPDRGAWRDAMITARQEYDEANRAWSEVAQENGAPEILYQAQFWIADARRRAIDVRLRLGEPFSALNIEPAISAAIIARDAALGSAWARVPASYVVELTKLAVAEGHRLFVAAKCAAPPPKIVRIEPAKSKDSLPVAVTTTTDNPLGGEPASSATAVSVTAVEEVGIASEPGAACVPNPGDAKRAWVRDIPPLVMRTIRACEELVARVPTKVDPRLVFACRYEIADTLMHYGHIKEATPRLDAIRTEACGKDPAAVASIRDLVVISVMGDDANRMFALRKEYSEGRSCATDLETGDRECDVVGGMHCHVGSRSADLAFIEAYDATDPKLRAAAFTRAARIYRYLLEKWSSPNQRYAGTLAYSSLKIGDNDGARWAFEYVRTNFCTDAKLDALKGSPDFTQVADYCANAAFNLGMLYSQKPGLAGLLDVYRYERAVEWFRACKKGPAAALCPPEVDAELARVANLYAAAASADVAP